MLEDLRTALRQLRRKPAIALVAALSLALGTGAAAAIFSCIDSIYFRPLPVPKTHELVRVFAATEQNAFGEISYPEYLDIRRQSTTLASLAVAQRRGADLLRSDEPDGVGIYGVSPDLFQVLGVRAYLGRMFEAADDKEPVVVLSFDAWHRWFGGDPAIVGRTIRLRRGTTKNVLVVGVLPPEFRDLAPAGSRDMWIPTPTFIALGGGAAQEFEDRRNVYFDAIGRLRPGASMEQLRAELSAIGSRLASAYPEVNARRRLTAMSDLDWRLHNAGTTGAALLAILLLVVGIACVNVANLLLAQIESRRKEIATRAALGATRWRLGRQLLLESLLIALLGIGIGVLFAEWLIAGLPALLGLPPAEVAFQLDARVFWSTAAVSMLSALLFGLAPAIIGARTQLTPSLRNIPSGGPRRFPLRGWLALFQLALSLVLLSATAVLGQSFWNARHGDIGLSRKDVLTAWQQRPDLKVERIALERIRGLPGVREVSLAFRAPLSGSGGGIAMAVTLPGHTEFSSGQSPAVIKLNSVEGSYFRVMGIRLLKGRSFTDSDGERDPRVAVISEAMARRYWPNEDPVGKDIANQEEKRTYRIVGVVADAPINNIGEFAEPYIYTSWWQNPFGEHTLLIETERGSEALAPVLRSALAEVNPELKRVSLVTMDQLIQEATTQYRAAAQLVAALGLLGLLLAAVGFYGVIAYGVTLRTREIGIRMAIGAQQTDASRLIVRQALTTALVGVAIGLPCSLAATVAMRSMLFSVSPWSPIAFSAATLILLGVAVAASWLPARRAAAVDPVVALRCE